MSDALSDWCDVLSFNLSSEGIVMLLVTSLSSELASVRKR